MLQEKKKSKSALVSNIQEGLRKKQELQEEWEAEEIAESVKKAAKLARERHVAITWSPRHHSLPNHMSQQYQKSFLNYTKYFTRNCFTKLFSFISKTAKYKSNLFQTGRRSSGYKSRVSVPR